VTSTPYNPYNTHSGNSGYHHVSVPLFSNTEFEYFKDLGVQSNQQNYTSKFGQISMNEYEFMNSLV